MNGVVVGDEIGGVVVCFGDYFYVVYGSGGVGSEVDVVVEGVDDDIVGCDY